VEKKANLRQANHDLFSSQCGIIEVSHRLHELSMDASFRRQIERARRMTGDERVREGLALWDRSLRIMTDGIRHQFPDASPEKVRQIRRERLARIRRIESLQ
jgi:hypothetical protein